MDTAADDGSKVANHSSGSTDPDDFGAATEEPMPISFELNQILKQ